MDFVLEMECSLRVMDRTVTMFNGVAGEKPQTETLWRQGSSASCPTYAS